MDSLQIGELKVKLPIVQGGMGVCVSLSGLASAVANEGGIGVISAVGIGMTEPDYRKNFREANKLALQKEIRKARAKSKGIIGVNIMLAVSDFEDLLKTALEEKIDIVFMGAGLPLKKPANIDLEILRNTKTKFVPKVSSGRAAGLIFKHWSDHYKHVPDALVVEGPLSGGHQGYKRSKLFDLSNRLHIVVKESLQVVRNYEQQYGRSIPVIAGGGIYSGGDIFNIMQHGAKGVKMGTRFVTTNECDVSDEFKQNYIDCSFNEITIIDSPVGLPARVIRNEFVDQIKRGMQRPVNCPWKCLRTCNFKEVKFCIAEALFNAAQGNFSQGFSFAGAKAFMAKKIESVKEVVAQLKGEYYTELFLREMIEAC